MYTATALTFAAALLSPAVSALGINCRGSSLCHLASWENKASAPVMQVLRDAVWQSTKDNGTTYTNGQHVICIAGRQSITLEGGSSYSGPETEGGQGSLSGSFSLSGGINTGGICLFPQSLTAPDITLGDIRSLIDKLLEHGCGTCGSVPVHFVSEGSNDPKDGILTFNYVHDPYCTGTCISATGGSGNAATPSSSATSSTTAATTPAATPVSAKFRRLAA